MPQNTARAVVLLSGGVDSATALAIAKSEGYAPYAITFRYGQRHVVEVDASRRVARHLGAADHAIVDIDLTCFGGSALTSQVDVPKDRELDDMNEGIPDTYVPARNTIFLSFSLAYAEVIGAFDIYVGVNALDYGGYPDCRPEYVEAFERMANLATKSSVQGEARLTIHAPLISLSKSEIVRKGLSLSIDYGLTSSCYDPTDNGEACGRCDACLLRLQAFAENCVADPAKYQYQKRVAT